MKLPDQKQETLNSIVNDLIKVDGVVAIVLGGSHATGTANETSDLDIGIYYSEQNPFRIDDIRSIANKYAVSEPVVTEFYEWGPWVNGGAWIETESGKVDFLYKNIEQIQSVIDKAKNGEWEKDFEQQPPYGFSSIIYLAETNICISLYDRDGIISNLKTSVQQYPPMLKQAVIQQSLWSAEFTIWHVDKFYAQQDVYNMMGCLTRAVKNIVDAVFAINEIYPVGDKRAMDVLRDATRIPPNFEKRIEVILLANKLTMKNNMDALRNLFYEIIVLADGKYKPFYPLNERKD